MKGVLYSSRGLPSAGCPLAPCDYILTHLLGNVNTFFQKKQKIFQRKQKAGWFPLFVWLPALFLPRRSANGDQQVAQNGRSIFYYLCSFCELKNVCGLWYNFSHRRRSVYEKKRELKLSLFIYAFSKYELLGVSIRTPSEVFHATEKPNVLKLVM